MKRVVSLVLAMVCMMSMFAMAPKAQMTAEAAIGLDVGITADSAYRSNNVAKATVYFKCTGTTAKLNKVSRVTISVNNGGSVSKSSIWAKSGSVTLTMPKFESSYTVTMKALDSSGKTLDTSTKTIKSPKFTGQCLLISSTKGSNNESKVTITYYTSAKQTSAFFEARDPAKTYLRGGSGTITLKKSSNGYYTGSKTITMKTGKWNFWIESNYTPSGYSKTVSV